MKSRSDCVAFLILLSLVTFVILLSQNRCETLVWDL